MKASVFAALILFLLTSISAHAESSFGKDLYWFKVALEQSDFSRRELSHFMNVFAGPDSFTLPQQNVPWGGNFFPMQDGGLAQRWQKSQKRSPDFPKSLGSLKDVKKWSSEQLQKLSPMEKYDLWMNNQDFEGTRFELESRGPERVLPPQDWEGFCNGVRCASILLPEPHYGVDVKLQDGRTLRFEPADLKALAGASYFYVEKYAEIGSPTRSGIHESPPNAAVFDLALRYYLAEKKKSFVIDSHIGAEIWNQAVVGFDRHISDFIPLDVPVEELSKEVTGKYRVALRLIVLGEVDIVDSNQVTSNRIANREFTEVLNVKYELFVDVNNNVLDGRWIQIHNKKKGVDFAWFARGQGTDSHPNNGGNPFLKFSKVRRLFKESVTPSCGALFSF